MEDFSCIIIRFRIGYFQTAGLVNVPLPKRGKMENAITKNTVELEQLENVIKQNIGAFYEVGRALMEIRDKGLYRDVLGYETFEAYCKARWSFTRQTAYQFIDSARVIENVSDCLQRPANEYQTRPLARLEPDQQRKAWQKAVDTAPDGKVTAAHVSKVVKEITGEQQKNKPEPKPTIPEHAVYFAQIAISQLERISDDDPTRQKALNMVVDWINKNRKGENK